MEEKLCEAVVIDRGEKVKEILRRNPRLIINWKNKRGRTALHTACEYSSVDMIPILLAHPDIDVNVKDETGATPFMAACSVGSTPAVGVLLRDSRVKINERDNRGSTPLKMAISEAHVDSMKWLIASGRKLDMGKPGTDSDAFGASQGWGLRSMAELLQRFERDPTLTMSKVRDELGITGEFVLCALFDPPPLTATHLVRFPGDCPGIDHTCGIRGLP